ncbi:tetratricopeptide repeat protein [Myroides marinus]|uniref:tetratricopeptide repeat protein n=1 Tax=Myroides marinus TaxID=703342 RepID=UPI0025781A40|nr:hypothetical protein [Myroides marinus]MDM1354282.1 hypothetical protein [Myroides marinus]
MVLKDKRIDEIKELYDQLVMGDELNNADEEKKIELYNKNQDLSEQILSIIEEVLREDATNKDALFWKIRIYNGPYYDDVSVMMSTAQEVIDKLQEDKKAVFSAFDWLSWIYENKLELKEKAIEILHDKLIEVSLLKEDFSLKDKEFGETYYMIAYLYRELEDYSTAVSFYKLAYEHSPDHYYATYQGGNLCLERGEFEDAYLLLNSYYVFHGNEYSASFAKEIEKLYKAGKIEGNWDLISLMYHVGIDYPEEFGAKNTREYGMRFVNVIEEELNTNPDNKVVLRMKIRYYLVVEKNSKKAFETLQKYYALNKEVNSSMYFTYFELAEKYGVELEEYPVVCDGFYGYNLMTRFLEKGGELRGDDDERSLKYYEFSKKVGLLVLPQIEEYFDKGLGSKVNNNAHGYAMLCNNLGIAIRNVVYLTDKDYDKEICKEALSLHKKGYEYSPFIENLENGLQLAELLNAFEEKSYFANELLTYHDEFSSEWMSVQGRILKSFIVADKYDDAKDYYYKIKESFEAKEIEDEDIVSEMIYLASDFFTYLRYGKNDFEKTIAFTEEFFSNPMYFDLVEDVAKVNYWFSLSWAYYGLNNRIEANKYFDLLIKTYDGNSRYQSTVDEIPKEFRLPVEEQEATNRLWEMSKMELKHIDTYALMDRPENVDYLNDIVDYILQGGQFDVEGWITDDCHLKVCYRALRENASTEIYDTSLDFYFKNGNFTIRFNIDEREEKVKKFMGLLSKTIWAKEMYTYYYFYSEDEEVSSTYDVYGSGKYPEYDVLAETLWNTWVSKIKSLTK